MHTTQDASAHHSYTRTHRTHYCVNPHIIGSLKSLARTLGHGIARNITRGGGKIFQHIWTKLILPGGHGKRTDVQLARRIAVQGGNDGCVYKCGRLSPLYNPERHSAASDAISIEASEPISRCEIGEWLCLKEPPSVTTDDLFLGNQGVQQAWHSDQKEFGFDSGQEAGPAVLAQSVVLVDNFEGAGLYSC
jgi:hypothetical protein